MLALAFLIAAVAFAYMVAPKFVKWALILVPVSFVALLVLMALAGSFHSG